MFDIGFPEMLVILVIALLVFGPGKMAEIGREAGKALREFRRATTDIQKEFNDALQVDEAEKKRAPVWQPPPLPPAPPEPPEAAPPIPSAPPEAAPPISSAPPEASAEATVEAAPSPPDLPLVESAPDAAPPAEGAS